jgi:hypothetical protein
MTNESLTAAALALPHDAKIDLIDALMLSVNSEIEPAIRESWLKEARERMAAFDRGEMQAHSREEVLSAVRDSLQK